MEIPARIVVEKMEEELKKLKVSVEEDSSSAYREQAAVIKTYCDLLLSANAKGQTVPTVQHATVRDVESHQRPAAQPADAAASTGSSRKESASQEKKYSIYDEGDNPESDSLFDF
ncbi:YwdI family protein [Evansella sp. LMS18]|jgi:hypothetical protein|uniref:YwdI family protein n=1 Tax=Evansella sp. LMS18 TaxID=2924033 RepID=UPI0020D13DDB|nr:YwdI family protein [Evansella sp. LMS18]UTR12268.1 YwdI family protein [Evansella sp. LMS18]